MATKSHVLAERRRHLRGLSLAAWIVGLVVAAPSIGVAQIEAEDLGLLSLRPVVGWGGHVNFGMDVGVRITSDVEVLVSAHRWSRAPIYCALSCPGVFAEGWRLGGGLRLSRDRAASRLWPFIHVEAGIHRFRYFGFSSGPRWSPFGGARGGVAARWSVLEVEVGVRVQRVSGFDYEHEEGRESQWGPNWFAGLQLGLGLLIS